MTVAAGREMPEFREFGIVVVRLLQGVLYSEDESIWNVLLTNEGEVADYLLRIGLVLVVDRAEGLAYLRQMSEDERSGGYERLPRLFRRTSLGYDATLMCVVLRDEYRRFEDEDLDNQRCVVETEQLLDAWKAFFPAEADELQLRKRVVALLHRLEDLKFVKEFSSDPEAWEVRKLLKARLPIEELENLRAKLLTAEQK